jgi:hypothetical protein
VSLTHWIRPAWSETRVRERSRGSEREKAHSPAPRCSSERHGRAVPARPLRSCLRTSSPSTHREYHATTLPPVSSLVIQAPEKAQQAQGRKPGEATDRRCMVAADPKRKHHPDLLGEEDFAISNWRHRKRRWRGVFCPRWWWRWSSGLAGIDKRWRRRSSRQKARGSAWRASEGLGWVGGSTQTRAWRS